MTDFEKLFNENREFIFKYLMKMTRDISLSEELTQETFFRAYMNYASLRNKEKASVWLCQIARNAYFAWYNEQKKKVPLQNLELVSDDLNIEETFVKNLSYQDILKEVTWFGDIKSNVGILNQEDLKFNSKLEGYFIDLKKDNNISLYNTSVLSTRVNIKRDVRPCLGIKKDLKIISGNGSKIAPFIVEV